MPLQLEGEVALPQSFDVEAFAALPDQVADVGAVVKKREGKGVWLRTLLDHAGRGPDARWATLASADGSFAICVPLQPLLERALLVYRLGDAPLPDDKGGPVRLILTGDVPCKAEVLDSCAQVKQLARIKLLKEREPDVGHEH